MIEPAVQAAVDNTRIGGRVAVISFHSLEDRIVKDLFIAQARAGVAVLMSTHLLGIAEELADTIGIIDRGRMLARGSLAEIREQVQIHGPLEHLFLKLTGGDRPRAVDAAPALEHGGERR